VTAPIQYRPPIYRIGDSHPPIKKELFPKYFFPSIYIGDCDDSARADQTAESQTRSDSPAGAKLFVTRLELGNLLHEMGSDAYEVSILFSMFYRLKQYIDRLLQESDVYVAKASEAVPNLVQAVRYHQLIDLIDELAKTIGLAKDGSLVKRSFSLSSSEGGPSKLRSEDTGAKSEGSQRPLIHSELFNLIQHEYMYILQSTDDYLLAIQRFGLEETLQQGPLLNGTELMDLLQIRRGAFIGEVSRFNYSLKLTHRDLYPLSLQ
jgi:hypothetical protein